MQLVKVFTSNGLPLNLEETKLDLRVDSSDDDETLLRMIRAAGDFAERRTGYVFNPGTYHAFFDDWDAAFNCKDRFRLELLRGPLRALNAVSYLTGNDVWADADLADFLVSRREKSFFVTPLDTFTAPDLFACVDGVRLSFDAGFDPDDMDTGLSGEDKPLDAGLKTMLTMLVGHFYKNRELFEADKMGDLELGAGSILGAYRQFY